MMIGLQWNLSELVTFRQIHLEVEPFSHLKILNTMQVDQRLYCSDLLILDHTLATNSSINSSIIHIYKTWLCTMLDLLHTYLLDNWYSFHLKKYIHLDRNILQHNHQYSLLSHQCHISGDTLVHIVDKACLLDN